MPTHSDLPEPLPIKIELRRVTILVVLGALLRLVSVLKPIDSGDLNRYEALARAMLEGRGYSFTATEASQFLSEAVATPVTELPPGYCVVVAAHYLIWDDPRGLIVSNWLMSVASIALLYWAVRPAGIKPALIAAALLAFNPWVIRWTGYYNTETCGLFLMCASLCCVTRLRTHSGGLAASFLLGLLSIALILTTPGVLFVSAGLMFYVVWLNRSRPAIAVAMLAGAAVFMAPWQIHCFQATGRFQPTIFTRSRSVNSATSFHPWVNSWMTSASEIAVYWNPPQFFDRSANGIFADTEQKAALREIAQGFRNKSVSLEQYNEAFRTALSHREAMVPAWKRKVLYPLLRSITLWTEHQRLLWGEGWKKMLIDIFFDLINYAYLAYFTWLAITGRRRSPLLVALIIGGTIGYTAVCGISGMTEYRRNYPLYPALLYLAGAGMPECRKDKDEQI